MEKPIEYCIKNRLREAGTFQFFMHQFVEAAIEYGIKPIGRGKRYKGLARLFSKYTIIFFSLIGHTLKLSKKRIIVTSNGASLLYDSWPYFHFEIIPMLWDCWPDTFDKLIQSLKTLKVKEAFFTQSAVANMVSEVLGIKTHWIPEGIDTSDYQKGESLSKRSIVLYELGRQHPQYHKIIMKLLSDDPILSYRSNTYNSDGELQKLAFSSAQDLIDSLPDIQITVSFPKSLTHPETSGGIETLTQRYWESMLTRSLIVGHCPNELLQVLGYNPVIEVDWEKPEAQLRTIISNIQKYQHLVDKNYQSALSHASWTNRIKQIDSLLKG